MWKGKRGSTLVLALLLFAFVLIVGLGSVMAASVSSNQTVKSLGGKQADFTAQSVLDAVFSKIKSGQIDPNAMAASHAEGTGTDPDLGKYSFRIDRYTDSSNTPDQYKVSVYARYPDIASNYSESRMYSIIRKFTDAGAALPDFDVIAQSTGYTEIGDTINAYVDGSLLLNNTGKTLTLGSGTITNNLELIGSLRSSFNIGSGPNNKLNVTGNIEIQNGSVNANVTSGGDVSFSGGSSCTGDIKARGNVKITVTVNGNIYSNNSVIIENGKIQKDIFANGNVTLSNGYFHNVNANGDVTITNAEGNVIEGNIYANGNVSIAKWITVKGNIIAGKNVNCGPVEGNITSNGSVSVTGNVSGDIKAIGDIELLQCNQAKSVTANGSVYINNSKPLNVSSIIAGGGIVVGKSKSVNSSKDGVVLNGKLIAYGVIPNTSVSIYEYNSTVNGEIQAYGDVNLYSYQNGKVITNGSVLVSKDDKNNGRFTGDVFARKDFTIENNGNQSCSGTVTSGGNSKITDGQLNGSIWVLGDGYFPKANSIVNGKIYLAGQFTGTINGNAYQKVNANDIILAPLITQTVPFPALTLVTPLPTQVPEVTVTVDTTQNTKAWPIPPDKQGDMTLNQFNVDVSSGNTSNYTVVNGNEYTINKSCTITISNSNNIYDRKIVFDATDQDLYITLRSSNPNFKTVTIANGLDILAEGDHNVFLLLSESDDNYVNLEFGDSCFVGNYDYFKYNTEKKPNLFIISNTQNSSSIAFNSGSTLYGYIYAPYAVANLNSGSPKASTKLFGAVTASKVFFNSWNTLFYRYIKPDMDGTGGDGGSGGESPGWKIIGTYIGS
jgi:cytoskeletal protein CcmA (bactofilin family)